MISPYERRKLPRELQGVEIEDCRDKAGLTLGEILEGAEERGVETDVVDWILKHPEAIDLLHLISGHCYFSPKSLKGGWAVGYTRISGSRRAEDCSCLAARPVDTLRDHLLVKVSEEK